MKINSIFKKYRLISIVSLAIIFVIPVAVFALNTWDTGYRIYTETKDVYVGPSQDCYQITNTSANSYFIPTKTITEWNSFASHLPAGLSVGSCAPTTGTWEYINICNFVPCPSNWCLADSELCSPGTSGFPPNPDFPCTNIGSTCKGWAGFGNTLCRCQ